MIADAKEAFTSDFGRGLRMELPSMFFDAAPVVADDALATGTKFDAMLKFSHNNDGFAISVLLNDPTSPFFEYLSANSGYDWKEITSSLSAAAHSFVSDVDLI